MIRKILFLSFIIFGFYHTNAQEKNKELSYGKAVNIAGRQRMLSQKFVKDFLLQEMGYKNAVISEELDSTILEFNLNYKLLKRNFKTRKTKSLLKEIDIMWNSFVVGINEQESDSVTIMLMQQNTRLLTLCNKFVHAIEDEYFVKKDKIKELNDQSYSDEALIEIINISGRQRMLAQRMCLYYIASLHFESNKSVYLGHIKEVFEEFDLSLIHLLQSQFNNDQSREQIARLLFFWQRIKSEEGSLYNQQFDIGDIYEITNKLTGVFEKITSIYQESYDNQLTGPTNKN